MKLVRNRLRWLHAGLILVGRLAPYIAISDLAGRVSAKCHDTDLHIILIAGGGRGVPRVS